MSVELLHKNTNHQSKRFLIKFLFSEGYESDIFKLSDINHLFVTGSKPKRIIKSIYFLDEKHTVMCLELFALNVIARHCGLLVFNRSNFFQVESLISSTS